MARVAVTQRLDTPSGKPWQVMENEFLRVSVSPAYDGRVASFVDKRSGVDYAWWGVPDANAGGFCTHRIRPGCHGHDGAPMEAAVQRATDSVGVTVRGQVSPGLFVSKAYELKSGVPRLDVTLRVRNIDKRPTPSFMPTVHNMMAQEKMEATFFVPMPDGLVVQPMDFWRSRANNFYKAPADGWYGFVLPGARQGLIAVFEPDTIERFFHWMSGAAGTWETWLKPRVLAPGEETSLSFSFVAVQDLPGYVSANRRVAVGMAGEKSASVSVYSVDVAGPARVEVSHESKGGVRSADSATVTLAPGRAVEVALSRAVSRGDLAALRVAVSAGGKTTNLATGPITYVDPTDSPLPDPELREYPKLAEVFPYGVEYSIEASGFHARPRLWIQRHMRMWRRAGANAVHVCNSNLDLMHWFLPLAAANGIRMIPGHHDFYGAGPGPRFGPHFVKLDLLKRSVAPFAEHDGLLAWSIIDEPHTDFLRTFVKMRKAIEEVDCEHPVTTITNYDGGNRGFAAFTSVLESDFYPTWKYPNPWPVADWCERTDAWGDGRPHWFMAQGYRDVLTPAAFRLASFAALANNAKGLTYFIAVYSPRCFGHEKTLHDLWGNPSDLWPDFARIGRHLVGVGPSLVATRLARPNPVEVRCEDVKVRRRTRPAIVTGLRRDAGLKADYVVAYNNDIESARKGLVSVPASGDEAVFDLFAMEQTPAARKGDRLEFEVAFEPGDGCIFLCASPGAFEVVRGKALRFRFDRERFDFYRDLEWGMDAALLPWTVGNLGRKASMAAAHGNYAEALDLLAADREAFDGLVAKDKALVGVRDALARIRRKLGELDVAAYDAGVKRVLVDKRWQFVRGDGPERVMLTGAKAAAMCHDLVFGLGAELIRLQCAFDSGAHKLAVEATSALEAKLGEFEGTFREELRQLVADPAAYGK